jgi:hypothetical protein
MPNYVARFVTRFLRDVPTAESISNAIIQSIDRRILAIDVGRLLDGRRT